MQNIKTNTYSNDYHEINNNLKVRIINVEKNEKTLNKINDKKNKKFYSPKIDYEAIRMDRNINQMLRQMSEKQYQFE